MIQKGFGRFSDCCGSTLFPIHQIEAGCEVMLLVNDQGSLNSIARLAVLLDNLLSVGQFGLIAYGENFQKYPK